MRTLAAAIGVLAVHFIVAASAQANGLGKRFDEIVAFGESSTDTGNVSQAQCSNEPPYLPADGFPLFWAPCTPLDPATSLPAYFDDDLADGFDGRLSNGRLWVEFLADALGVEPPRPSTKFGTNYAHAGAKTGPDWTTVPGAEDVNLRVNLYPNNPVPSPTPECPQPVYQAGELVCGSEVPHINTQIAHYLADRGDFSPQQLVVIWGGANDIRDVPLDPAGPEAAIANIVTNLVTAVGTAASAGAKDIVVLNQLNAARAPITQAACDAQCGGESSCVAFCLAQVETVVTSLNASLSAALEQLPRALLRQGRLHYVDVYTAGEVAVQLSELFGEPFANTTDPAMLPDIASLPMPLAAIAENAENYLFWDVIHPTEKAYRITAYQVCKTLEQQIPGFKPECLNALTSQ